MSKPFNMGFHFSVSILLPDSFGQWLTDCFGLDRTAAYGLLCPQIGKQKPGNSFPANLKKGLLMTPFQHNNIEGGAT
jgi:hypothetical protein